MKIIPIIILSIFLQGCSLLNKRPEPPPITTNVIQIDSEALQPCVDLPENSAPTTFEESLERYIGLGELYGKCAIRQNGSIKILKKIGNIK